MFNWLKRRALPLIVAAWLSGCAGANSDLSTCPPWPEAGPKVAAELERVPYEGYEDFWNWVARLDTLKRQLDACR